MITTYNTAVTDAASEILGKERRSKKPWVTKDILDRIMVTDIIQVLTTSSRTRNTDREKILIVQSVTFSLI